MRSIAVHPDNNNQILAASPDDKSPGVFLSQDGGRTFQQTLCGYVHAVVWHKDTSRVYAGLRGVHLAVSANGGKQWQEIDLNGVRFKLPPPHFAGHPYDILSLIAKPPYLYIGVEAGGLIFSSDDGKSFRLNVHYPPGGLTGPHQDIHAMATDPINLLTVYVVTGNGFYKTDNGGETWKEYSNGLIGRYLTAVTSVHGYPGLILTGGSPDAPGKWNRFGGARARLYRSVDGGITWTIVSGGLPAELKGEVGMLIADPTTPGRVLLGTWHNLEVQQGRDELYESLDAGESWHLIVQDLPPINGGAVLNTRMAAWRGRRCSTRDDVAAGRARRCRALSSCTVLGRPVPYCPPAIPSPVCPIAPSPPVAVQLPCISFFFGGLVPRHR